MIETDPRSADLIKPWLNGREIGRWHPKWAGQYVIFTRRGIDISLYPAIHDHLSQWQEDLAPKARAGQGGPGRKPGSYKWFEIQDNVAYHEEFLGPKIIFQEIAYHSQFAFDSSGLFCNKTAHIVPTSDLYVLAVLNSRCAWWAMNHLLPHMKDGALLLQGSLISGFPIPDAPFDLREEIVRQTSSLLVSVEQREKGELLSLETSLSALVETAYGLTALDREVLAQSLPPRDPLVVLQERL